MTFKEGYRLEKVYFENIYTLLNMLKSVDKNNVDMNTVKELLDNAIADNESIILIYKNLGELYSEVADNYSKLLADLEALKENLESWKDEINEKIDDLNNYIMSLIRDIEQRLDSLEQRMSDAEEAIDSLEDRMDTAEADIDALEGRMDTAEDDIDALEGRMDTAEDDIDSLEGRMDTAEDDIDNLEQNKQDNLTAGFGIDIDSNNEISVDTNDVQEKLIAGQNITFTPDATDPTKTVIDAQGGATYTPGKGILIESDVIKNNFLTEYNVPIKLTQTNPNIKTIGALCDFNPKTGYYSEITTDTPINDSGNNTIGPGSFKYFNSDYLKIECGIPFNNWDLTQTDEHIIFDGFLLFNLKRHGSGNLAQIFECPLYIPVYYELNLDGTIKFVSNSKYFYIRPLCELYGDIITATSWFYYTYKTVGRIYCNGEPINSNNFNNLSSTLQTHLNSFISSSGGQKIFLTPYKRDTYL